jgi:fumarylacetoacetase
LDEADQQSGAFALELEVRLTSAAMRAQGMPPVLLSRGSATAMYWTMAQIVTHHASNGCNLQPGDLIGTGTISGAEEGAYGSLLEISRGGSQPVTLPTGETRTFLEDGDEVTLHAAAKADGYAPIGFGPCRALILPAP